jgi:hypothetical protein
METVCSNLQLTIVSHCFPQSTVGILCRVSRHWYRIITYFRTNISHLIRWLTNHHPTLSLPSTVDSLQNTYHVLTFGGSMSPHNVLIRCHDLLLGDYSSQLFSCVSPVLRTIWQLFDPCRNQIELTNNVERYLTTPIAIQDCVYLLVEQNLAYKPDIPLYSYLQHCHGQVLVDEVCMQDRHKLYAEYCTDLVPSLPVLADMPSATLFKTVLDHLPGTKMEQLIKYLKKNDKYGRLPMVVRQLKHLLLRKIFAT